MTELTNEDIAKAFPELTSIRKISGPVEQTEHARYLGTFDEQVRWGFCQDPRGVLVEGHVYEVERYEVHTWHTKVFIKGIDSGRGFPGGAFEFKTIDDPAKCAWYVPTVGCGTLDCCEYGPKPCVHRKLTTKVGSDD